MGIVVADCRVAAPPYPAYKIWPVGPGAYRVSLRLNFPKYFALQEGGKPVNPRELTQVSDRGEQVQPTHL